MSYCNDKELILMVMLRKRHIAIRYHFVLEGVQNRMIVLKYVATDEMIADIQTSPELRKTTPQTISQLRCSASWSGEIHEQLIYLLAFNIFLSITAALGNILILVALRKRTSLFPPSKLLYRSLATTDLCVGLILQPLSVAYWMSLVYEEWNLCRFAFISSVIASYTLCSVSLLTVTAISVDRLLALLLGLRYRQVVTLKRTYVIVVTFWITSAVAATSYLINRLIPIWYGHIVIPLCMVTSIVAYSTIFLTLRHHQTQLQGHVQQKQATQMNSLNMARYKKAVSSALWVQCTLVACYLPYGIVTAMFGNGKVLSSSRVFSLDVAGTFVFFNSTLNPFLYCWKIREVKQAVKQTIREALCCLSSKFINA
ncbi:adenosine receptor A3-like [Oculina patagonica]